MITKSKINRIIDLAHKRNNAYNTNSTQAYKNFDSQLEKYLKGLTFDEIKSLQAIMYLGRDEDYDQSLTPKEIYDSQLEYFDKDLGWNTQQIETNQIMEKMPLGDYLENGKKILKI